MHTFDCQIENAKQDLKENAQHNFEMNRQALSLIVFLWHWLFESMESKCKSVAPKSKITGKGTKGVENHWEGSKGYRLKALITIHKFLVLNLESIFISSADLDLIINEYNDA